MHGEANRTYHDQVVGKMNENTIIWRNGIYEKKGIMMDSEIIVDMYERGAKEKESKMQKMKIGGCHCGVKWQITL